MFRNISYAVLFLLALFYIAEVNCEESLGVVNGEVVEPHSLPYQVAIKTIINDREILCGGSLIKTNKVLTAAWCVSGADSVEVILGAHNISEVEETQVRLNSSTFVIHEEYDPDTHLNDIAIVVLPEEVALTDAIQLIATPSLGDILKSYSDELGQVAGWGRFDDSSPAYSDVLRRIQATIIPNIACTVPYLFSIQPYQICLTGVQFRQNICLGDSGSPLIADNIQVGIASYGSDFGCSAGFPGVYTRLTSFYFWLETHV
ncbi:chymotrypsin-like isoform X2 [Rhynchophorus ferrugineus]|uniref:Peptidase S1 domain-containing protein n=1 Tax=Rhynchophorus ferrugineus TaxID=354439 RepID=A0A834M7A8_RHYFE|nr:hypothetical protein GWI33_019121 [Rhynchophorus ferrugineus]